MQKLIDGIKFNGKDERIFVDESKLPMSTPIKDFYKGKNILLTGGSGFIGQLLVEKMLRIGVNELYLLTRPKKDKTPQQRLKELCAGPVFDRLRNIFPNFMEKIKVINGDLQFRNLGLSEDIQEMLIKNVDYVIHAAADVRFDETLKAAIEVNIRATRDLLNLAEKMEKLQIFVHVSTAYSNCPRREIDEKFYESPLDPYKMIKFAEMIDQNLFNENDVITLTSKIINPWPNTYTFTKALSEDMVKDYGERLPIAIIRPSIIIATNEDPFPGWTENIYGLNGILSACALGLLRALYLRRDYVGDVIPADFVSNSVLAVAWLSVKERYEQNNTIDSIEGIINDYKTKIYNCTTSAENPITWGLVNDSMYKMYENYPPKRGLWINAFTYTRYKFLYKLSVFFYHILPSLAFDTFLKLSGKKLRLLPVYRKIEKFTGALAFFTTNEWFFFNNNMRHLCKSLNFDDSNYFPCDVKRMKWHDYTHSYARGLRRYIGKETIDTLPAGRKRMNIINIFHNLIKLGFYFFWIAFIYFILRVYNIIDPINLSFRLN